MRMRAGKVLSRFRLALFACLAVAVFAGVMVASAGAQGEGGGQAALSPVFNPQETNVPYLAWRGEEVRLVKCTHDDMSSIAGAPTTQSVGGFTWLDTSMTIFNYSGPQENSFDGPKAVTNGASIFYDRDSGRWCVRADFISNKPGIVTVKFTLSIKGVILAQHDFLIGWMAVNSAAITNPGTVTDNPGDEPGNSVNVQVTGSIPLNAEFQADWGLPATLVLPRDWALWASKMATTDDALSPPYGQAASTYWDIHDSSGPGGDGGAPDVHVKGGACTTLATSLTIDQVDNCNGPGNPQTGLSQSRVFGDFGTAFGPFDPSYSDTLLSDGNLNSFDAPMPPLKVVFNTAGGMGFFDDSCLNDKSSVYNRNFDASNPTPDNGLTDCIAKGHTKNEAHALYAPYYNAYIPATSRDPWGAASGTDGPVYSDYTGQPNNFPGYQWYGGYHYWQIARENVIAAGGDSPCLLTTRNYEPVYRQLNSGDTNITEFTDEHGEARAQWQPGEGNDNFGTSVGFVDDNGGCDLEGVALGDQTITASVQYPFQPIGTAIPASGSIVKHINNFFHKTVSCVRKNNAGSAIAYICTATAIDIDNDGSVFNGEKVCFSREPENVWYGVGGSYPHDNGYCVPLAGGKPGVPASVSVETPATIVGSVIDVQAYFAGEKLLRDTCITVGQSPSTPGPCGGGGTGGSSSTTTSSGTTTGTSSGTTSGITTLPTTKKGGTKANIASVAAVQLVLNKNGTRVLRVKIHSTKPSARISIRLINAKGKVVTVALRTVKTNRLVTVRNLRISKQVKRVRVAVVQ
jgi:hypothetical protein